MKNEPISSPLPFKAKWQNYKMIASAFKPSVLDEAFGDKFNGDYDISNLEQLHHLNEGFNSVFKNAKRIRATAYVACAAFIAVGGFCGYAWNSNFLIKHTHNNAQFNSAFKLAFLGTLLAAVGGKLSLGVVTSLDGRLKTAEFWHSLVDKTETALTTSASGLDPIVRDMVYNVSDATMKSAVDKTLTRLEKLKDKRQP